ncbi:hypothetical protein BDA96_08G073200 [Sorghum bicolor]|uniref:DUF7866 domain-containing protein n=2 Tax=Sorghum bicolor TaxID=4558 RepID=A0A921QHC9_SORBI|nr:hypothetical protein BDA96_08G073200 [Sorghum bicolor]OQU78893.1 hypothetical protein SORBI_3008G068450 [Sorghum bicolor]
MVYPRASPMAKITKMLLTLMIIILLHTTRTSICSQGDAVFDGSITGHNALESTETFWPLNTQTRKVCAPCECCSGNNCYTAPSCCLELMCNQPHRPVGSCITIKRSCTCTNCS